ncbi:MAG: hypothetical protein ABFR47_01885 [Verrucomicrobiota bacterium]
MLKSGGVIKSAMVKRGYKHRRSEDQFTIRGEYAQNLQYVFSLEHSTKSGLVVDLVYFSVDVLSEKLVIGLYRENTTMENGVYANSSRTLNLLDFNAEELDRVLNKLVTPLVDKLNKER